MCRFMTHPEPDDEIPAPESARGEPQSSGVDDVGFRPVVVG